MTNPTMRDAFEKDNGGFFDMRRQPNGLYLSEETRYRFNLWGDAWQAALSTLPRVTEENMGDTILAAMSEAPNGECVEYVTKALRAKLPHIFKEN